MALCVAMLLMVTLSAGEAGETHMLDAQDPVAQRQEAQKEDNAEQNKEAAKQGDTHNKDGKPETEASAKPESSSAVSQLHKGLVAAKMKHVAKHSKHKEVHSKATDKVKELEAKLGIHHLPKASALDVDQQYAKYNTNERERKRKARFPAPQNKEQAVKRMYEIMHKNKLQNFQSHASIQGGIPTGGGR